MDLSDSNYDTFALYDSRFDVSFVFVLTFSFSFFFHFSFFYDFEHKKKTKKNDIM